MAIKDSIAEINNQSDGHVAGRFIRQNEYPKT